MANVEGNDEQQTTNNKQRTCRMIATNNVSGFWRQSEHRCLVSFIFSCIHFIAIVYTARASSFSFFYSTAISLVYGRVNVRVIYMMYTIYYAICGRHRTFFLYFFRKCSSVLASMAAKKVISYDKNAIIAINHQCHQ
jgi:hypothetical protein